MTNQHLKFAVAEMLLLLLFSAVTHVITCCSLLFLKIDSNYLFSAHARQQLGGKEAGKKNVCERVCQETKRPLRSGAK